MQEDHFQVVEYNGELDTVSGYPICREWAEIVLGNQKLFVGLSSQEAPEGCRAIVFTTEENGRLVLSRYTCALVLVSSVRNVYKVLHG